MPKYFMLIDNEISGRCIGQAAAPNIRQAVAPVTMEANKVIFLRQLPEELVRLRFDPVHVSEAGTAFADGDCPQLASPLVNVLKQKAVNVAQGGQRDVVEVGFELLDACLGQFDFGRVQGGFVGEAELVDRTSEPE